MLSGGGSFIEAKDAPHYFLCLTEMQHEDDGKMWFSTLII